MYTLRDFGSYTVGGHHISVKEGAPFKVNFTREVSFEVDPKGHFAVEHGYVQFFVPEARNAAPPVLLVHGGGMSGSCWETTPDGRPGWLHLLLDRGFEVHVLDTVERGRAGFVPGLWPGQPVLRSLEEAWSLFRIGLPEGFATRRAFVGQRFPVPAFDSFAQRFVPRWFSTAAAQTTVLGACLSHLGEAIVICHSQGAEAVFDACHCSPHRVSRIIALEPSALPKEGVIPTTLVCGDYIDCSLDWQARDAAWRHSAEIHSAVSYLGVETFGPGNSHMLMMDMNSADILEAALHSM